VDANHNAYWALYHAASYLKTVLQVCQKVPQDVRGDNNASLKSKTRSRFDSVLGSSENKEEDSADQDNSTYHE